MELIEQGWSCRKSVLSPLSSVADPDPCGSVSFWSAGSASMKRIRIRVAKNQPKSWKISTKINENHKNIIHFFTDFRSDLHPDQLFHKTDPRIRIWIHNKMKRIRKTAFISNENVASFFVLNRFFANDQKDFYLSHFLSTV